MQLRTPFTIPKIWLGSTVYIIGGGPSLIGMDLTPLHSKRVIGVNQAVRLGQWIDIVYFGDCAFYADNAQALNDFGGLILSSCQRVPQEGWPGVHVLKRKRSKPYGLETGDPQAIAWNNNSGGSAINIAYHLGASRVVLLGFDMHHTDKTHWHDYYRKRPKNWDPFPRHLAGFAHIAKDAKAANLEIINATPSSAIKEFPFVPLEELC